ncbi:Zinc finger, ring/fyve/phd-type [Globisporangium polare]
MSADAQAAFRAQDVFRCPELDVRMRKYLVRLANETANHLIRDTLEPNLHRDDDARSEHDDDPIVRDDDDDGQVDARAAATNGLLWKKLSVVKGIQILRGYDVALAAEGHAKDGACCLRGLSDVNASIEEFALLFKLDSNRKFAEHGLLFNPDLLDMATLYALVQPSGDHPRRYVGIKWCLVQSPSKLFRNRDFCYLECQKEFRDAKGRRGWVRSMHSIKMPCCPSLESSYGIVRASMYRCGLTAVESDKPGVLNVTYTIEMDLKGHFPEIFQPSFISQRIATLASIDKFLQQQRLSSSPLLGDLDLRATSLKNACHLCYRAFSTFTRRVVCRKCGQGVCKSCSGEWELDVPVIGKKKVRICTVCSAEARYSHVAPLSARARGSASLPLESVGGGGGHHRPHSPQAVARRDRRSLSFNSPGDFHHLQQYYRDNGIEPHQPRHHHQQQQPRMRSQSHRNGPGPATRKSRPSSYNHASEFQFDSNSAVYEQYRPTRESRNTAVSDSLFEEYSTDGVDSLHNNVRATTDLTEMWDPREEGFPPAAMPSPASYFNSVRLASKPVDAPAPEQPQPRTSQKIGPIRDSILSQQQQPVYEEPPRDSYSEHQRRQSDYLRFQQRRHTTNYGPSSAAQQHQSFTRQEQQQFPYFGYQDPHSQQQQQRRRQQSYPIAADSSRQFQQQPQTRATDIYPQQRHRQQLEREVNFPAPQVNGSSRNFALEFFNEQYRNSNKPRSQSSASVTSSSSYRQPLQQNYQQPQQQQQFYAPPPPAPLSSDAFARFERFSHTSAHREMETRHSQPHSQPHSRHHHQRQYESESHPSNGLDQTQTAGEVVEYVETPDGEWVEQRRTNDYPQKHEGYQRSYSGEDDEYNEEDGEEGDEEALNPGYCIYCGSKRVMHHGMIESTCTCELGGRRDLENRKNSANTQQMRTEGERASEKMIQSSSPAPNDVDQVIPLLMERLSQQSLHSYAPRRPQSSYSE